MKLYAFQPNGHGSYSWFVCANSVQEALDAVTKHIAETCPGAYEQGGWGTNYYTLATVEPGVVISNSND